MYEGHEEFSALPSYGVIPGIASFTDTNLLNAALKPYNIELNPVKLVHGEQFLELYKPLGTSGALKTTARVVDVLDKGSGAVIILAAESLDAESGEKVLYNQAALFVVGAGNFNGPKMSSSPEVRPVVDVPSRPPDVTVTEKTSPDQATLYRLTGDKNPLHVDPAFAAMAGFDRPILHGLCTYGFVTRHVLKHFAGNDVSLVTAMKARFASSLFPGQTLVTNMWREGNRIHVESKCKETDKAVVTGGYYDLKKVVLLEENSVIPVSTSDPSSPSAADLAFDSDDANALLTDVVFEEIGRRIAMAPELASKVNGIFTFVIVKDRQEVKVWTMDMKQRPGVLYQGHSKAGPADCVIRITDQDMTALAVGELDPVRAFMTGKLKIKGNLMATQRLQALFELNSAEVYEKDLELNGVKEKQEARGENFGEGNKVSFSPVLAEKWGEFSRLASAGSSVGYKNFSDGEMRGSFDNHYHNEHNPQYSMSAASEGEHYSFAASDSSPPGSASSITPIIDLLFEQWLPSRLDDIKELVPVIKTVYQWNILQKGQVASVWTLDLKNGDGSITRGPPATGKADCVLSIEDETAVKIFEGKEDAMRAFMSGRLKITGNIMAAQKLQQVWADEAEKVRNVLADLKAGKSIGNSSGSSGGKAVSEEKKSENSVSEDPDIAAYPSTGIKGDIFFNIFKNRCHEEPEFMQRLRVCFQFNLTKDGKPVCVWTADNKSSPEVQIYRSAPRGIKPDVTATVEDDDLLKILTGRVNPQRLFMMGRVKVKGNIMLLQKLNGLWAEFQKLGKTPELPLIVDVMLEDPLIPGLKSEGAVIECIQRLVRLPELKATAEGYHLVQILQDGQEKSQWTLDLKDKVNFIRGVPKKGAVQPDSVLTLEDLDFARLVLRKTTLDQLMSEGRVKLQGNDKMKEVYHKLFMTPTSLKPKL